MLRAAALVTCVASAACGRIGFDAERVLDDGGDGATVDGTPPDAAPPWCGTFGPFGAAVDLTSIESTTTDWGPSLSADRLEIMFSTNRDAGTFELWHAVRASASDAFPAPSLFPGTSATDLYDPALSSDRLHAAWSAPDGIDAVARATIASAWGAPGQLISDGTLYTGPRAPDLSPDLLHLYFTGSDRATGDIHMYETTRATTASAFADPVQLAGVDGDDEYGSARADGLEVVYQTNVGGNYDLVDATRTSATPGTPFTTRTPIAELNTAVDEADADLSDDGTTLVFSSPRSDGVGGYDLYVATRSCIDP